MSSLNDLLRRIRDLKNSIRSFDMDETSGKSDQTVKRVVPELIDSKFLQGFLCSI